MASGATRRLRVSKAMSEPLAAKFAARVHILELADCGSGIYLGCPSSTLRCLDPVGTLLTEIPGVRRDHDMYSTWTLSKQTLAKIASLDIKKIQSLEPVAVTADGDPEIKRYTPATFLRNQLLGVCKPAIVLGFCPL